MKFRVGGWVLAIAFTALVILKLLRFAMRGAVGEPIPLPMTIVAVALTSLVVVAISAWALDSQRWAGALFGAAAIGQGCLIAVQFESLDPLVLQLLGVLSLLGSAAFAGAAMCRGAGKRLGWTLVVVAVLHALLVVVTHGTVRGFLGSVLLDLMSIFLALDLLGAFPVHARIPHAAIPNLALGRLVTAIGFALVAVGGFVVWTTFDEVVRRSVSRTAPLTFGGIAVVAGVLALWRRRRGVSLPIAIAIVISVVALLDVAANLAKRRFEAAVLTRRELPNARIAMPSGEDSMRAFSDVGNVEIAADHVELDAVGLAWGYTELPGHDPAWLISAVDGVNTEVKTIVVPDPGTHHTAFLIWTCNGIQMRAVFGADGNAHRLDVLAARIARTVECVPTTAGKLAIPLPPQPGWTEVDNPEPRIRSFRGPGDAYLDLTWSKEANWNTILAEHPVEMFRWLDGPDEVTGLRRTTIVIDGEYRWIAELEDRGRRKVVGVYFCRALGAFVAVGYSGPESAPRDTAIDLIRAARCP